MTTFTTITWVAGVSGDFADGTNWSGGVVPGPDSIAKIEATGTYTVESSKDETVRNLFVTQDATLDVSAGVFGVALSPDTGTELTVGSAATISVGDYCQVRTGQFRRFCEPCRPDRPGRGRRIAAPGPTVARRSSNGRRSFTRRRG